MAFFLGCASLTPERVSVIAAIAGQAAQLGIQLWLEQNPTHRAAVEHTVTDFAHAVKTGKTNPVSALHSLPTSSLAGPHGDVYISGDRLVVWDTDLNKSVAATGEAERPVLRAVLSGLKRGVAPLPPKLPAVRNRTVKESLTVAEPPLDHAQDWRRYFQEHPRAGFVRTNEPPPLSDAELDAQFEQVKAKLAERTNTVSTVDVQPTPNGASVVTVRWQGRPGVYCVQQRDEGSVDWVTFAHATNAASWTTPWHPSLPLGHWRVVRK